MKGILINYRILHGLPLLRGGLQEGVLGLPEGEFGIKLTEIRAACAVRDRQERQREVGVDVDCPCITKACDLCEGRVAKGKMPMCVQHCQAWCMYHGEVEDLAKKMDGKTRWALLTAKN